MAETRKNEHFLEVKDLTVYYTVSKIDTKAVNGGHSKLVVLTFNFE